MVASIEAMRVTSLSLCDVYVNDKEVPHVYTIDFSSVHVIIDPN